jgi:hypothetical protein
VFHRHLVLGLIMLLVRRLLVFVLVVLVWVWLMRIWLMRIWLMRVWLMRVWLMRVFVVRWLCTGIRTHCHCSDRGGCDPGPAPMADRAGVVGGPCSLRLDRSRHQDSLVVMESSMQVRCPRV